MSKSITCKKCGSEDVILVEYAYPDPNRYDGWSETWCQEEKCGVCIGRWTGKILKDGESEPPFGEKRKAATEEAL